MLTKVKQTWSTNEIAKLTALTKQCRESQREIDWKTISRQMERRTELQCKSYYQNILKKTLTQDIRKNHAWNRIELMMLFNLVISNNGDFQAVHEQMSNFTIHQLKSQWAQMKAKQHLYTADFQKVTQNNIYVQQIPTRQLMQEEYILRIGFVQKHCRLSTESIDPHYARTYQLFWSNVDLNQLTNIFQEELVRRNIRQPQKQSEPEIEIVGSQQQEQEWFVFE
ncbi:SANT/Myb_domain [Hexamita inflata]|uniref:SANT/Myb domain n=1 Tax=Hexamita inflata TaxID=28002 RepID=A0AA86PBM7_9EUKA|nr:SANT/Myb domain [Hexamita inflata]